MKILLIANRSPWPPINGATIRQYHILKALKARGDEVHVFGFAEDGEAEESTREILKLADSAHIEELHPIGKRWGAGVALLTGAPLSVGHYRSARMARQIDRCLREHEPDALVVHSSNVASYVPAAYRARTLLDMADVDSEKFRQYAQEASGLAAWIYRTEHVRLRRYELRAIEQFGRTCLVTAREAEVLTELSPSAATKLLAIPNGVDTDLFCPDASRAPIELLPDAERAHLEGEGPTLVFTGVMNYPPNVDAACHFAREVLPLVRQRHPGARFIIVGSRPTAEVKALAQIDGVRVTGFVQDAVPYFRAADVYVLPLRVARGIQNKALEAMACACPIVATASVASGVGASDGQQLLVADAPADFARRVGDLLSDATLAGRLATQARQYVLQHFAWPPLMNQLLAAMDACATHREARR